jgi:DNA replication protein DnaC
MNRFLEGQSCSKCEGTRYKTMVDGPLARAVRCQCLDSCGECYDTGMLFKTIEDQTVAAPCDCSHLDKRIRLFNDATIPARFVNCWIEDLDDRDPTQKEVKYALLNERDTYEPGGMGMLLWGRPGVGKTHLLCGLLSYLTLERGISCRYVEFMQLLYDLKKGWSEGRWESAVVQPLLEAEVLVVDELGKGKNSEWELSILDELISTRYNARKTLHCATNYNAQPATRDRNTVAAGLDLSQRTPQTLGDRLDDRIYSRLTEMCRFYRVNGEDWRAKPKRQF